MREVLLDSREDKQQIYLPEKCIGCGTCVQICPKGELVIGSVGAVARGLIDKDFIEKRKSGDCVFCTLCSRICPVGALEFRVAGQAKMDGTFLSAALKPTLADDSCLRCGLCAEVCPQGCIEIQDRRLAEDGSLRFEGQTLIDTNRCVHCGWCARICPVGAISFEKPFAGKFSRDEGICQACRTCVHTCPANALFNREWGPGEIVEKVTHREDACIYCGACAQACPVRAIAVQKTAIVPEMQGKKAFEKKLSQQAPWLTLTSILETDEEACLGCGNCVIVCPVNALSDPYLAAGHLNELDEKPLLEVKNGTVHVVNQEACGSCATCSMICPADAIWLKRREVA
ncbi:MAG: 4Fe-4S dicluster domain-containing protein [Methanosarcinales archaeon]|nr:4Fe-4S dicluster domain-containing protein [Methanosarcinales archaeon]